ncbi:MULTISPECIES: SusD/RagB family nutrient-binding outer membrane lipoprotein [Olivibacter]|uniref:SusD/RagB family nutrient-binding outer membrane lipoprotein n=2 Tax=Olivibacter TaxID=376469 RepID=A0ABV6HCX9_9SPHI|nr:MULTISPECIES: SusD/RagB family nutrient-binding outer membrane lipoprotein [Olivibacter]MDX3917133.1 SusD/RagB family nutrient-binding outer membrane lipoprotein [Pseudosphingobacterium sp.]QEK99273.1 SusD/RagB family nutrient-binding outer membrane lipoprotein [Olivibacter sp. LS-1]
MKTTMIKYMSLVGILATFLFSCSKFEEINTNPNATDQVTAGMLASNMILDITRSDISTQKSFMQPFILAKYVTWQEGQESFQYNRITRGSFGRLSLLRNIEPMIAYAQTPELKNSYTALGHFIRAWQSFILTMQMGDIPFSEATKGETEGIIKPKYDTQKEVFLGILNELDEAHKLFGQGVDFEGDPIYQGSKDQWQRLVNSFELYVLLNLYKKTDDPDLSVISRFQDIVNSRPLMRNYNDNFALTYLDKDGQKYPWVNINSSNPFTIYPMLTANLLEPLKAMQDRRLFYYAKPSSVKLAAGLEVSDWDAYPSVEASASFNSLQGIRASKDFTDLNDRYADLFNAEPVGQFTYWDLQFILAEASLRGWVSNSAVNYYNEGITASMQFLASHTPDNEKYHHNMQITDGYIQTYLNANPLKGAMEQQLEQIITQKYVAGFLQDCDYFAWFENRRTGYPTFILNPATNLNDPTTSFPKRWLYPADELNYNGENVAAAIQRQFGGNDNVNQEMWVLK